MPTPLFPKYPVFSAEAKVDNNPGEVTWGSLFDDPDAVGSSEYRALHSLIGNATELSNLIDEVDPDEVVSRDNLQSALASLEELAEYVAAAKRKIKVALKKIK